MDTTDLAVWDRVVLASGETVVTIGGAICAAHFREELEPNWKRVLEFAGSEREAEPDEADLQARSEQFRIDRDLISAEEAEQWLDQRGLTLEDFSDFLFRECVYDASAGAASVPEMMDYALAPPDLREVLRVDLLFNGAFDRLATRLAWRIADIIRCAAWPSSARATSSFPSMSLSITISLLRTPSPVAANDNTAANLSLGAVVREHVCRVYEMSARNQRETARLLGKLARLLRNGAPN